MSMRVRVWGENHTADYGDVDNLISQSAAQDGWELLDCCTNPACEGPDQPGVQQARSPVDAEDFVASEINVRPVSPSRV